MQFWCDDCLRMLYMCKLLLVCLAMEIKNKKVLMLAKRKEKPHTVDCVFRYTVIPKVKRIAYLKRDPLNHAKPYKHTHTHPPYMASFPDDRDIKMVGFSSITLTMRLSMYSSSSTILAFFLVSSPCCLTTIVISSSWVSWEYGPHSTGMAAFSFPAELSWPIISLAAGVLDESWLSVELIGLTG